MKPAGGSLDKLEIGGLSGTEPTFTCWTLPLVTFQCAQL